MGQAQEFVERINSDLATLRGDFEIVECENLRVEDIGWDTITIELSIFEDGDSEEVIEQVLGCLGLLFGDVAPFFQYCLRIKLLGTAEEIELQLDYLADDRLQHPPLALRAAARYHRWDHQRRMVYAEFFERLVH